MPWTSRALPVVTLVSYALAAAGCSGDNDSKGSEPDAPIVQLGAPGETNRVLTEEEAETLGAPTHTQADVDFVHGMIAHHQQALLMTALVPERTERDDLPLLAERMDVSQRDEIAQMERWLEERGVERPPGDDHAAHTGIMPGMLTEEELDELRSARGARFDRLFLESMIRHHQGAVVMVETLLTGGEGGQESQVFQMAQHMDADQRVEISRMTSLLAEMAA
jgi:uncharacterized protein (DUF305 family)